jgi:hypothetical protein
VSLLLRYDANINMDGQEISGQSIQEEKEEDNMPVLEQINTTHTLGQNNCLQINKRGTTEANDDGIKEHKRFKHDEQEIIFNHLDDLTTYDNFSHSISSILGHTIDSSYNE